ncbi:MAG: penicillin-binding protein, partial [Sphingobacteriales bacterium]
LQELENPEADLASEIISADGVLMGKYYNENRSEVKYQDISKNVINALIATEDERFYEHSGIDAQALGRVAYTLGTQGGGSTITQQLAKLMMGQGRGNVVKRGLDKIKEWIVAVKLERNFTKEEIITLYLNRAPWGNVYGIRNASLTYFQKEPANLKIEEAAVLVGMLKGPSIYEPIRHAKNSIDRRNTVINQMVKARQGFLTAADGEKLKAKPLVTNYKPIDEAIGIAPYYRRVLLTVLKDWCNKNTNPRTGEPYNLTTDGLKVYTTIDSRMQKYAEEAVEQHMPELQRKADAYFKIRKNLWKGREDVIDRGIKQSERWKNLKEDEMSDEDIRKTFMVETRMKIFSWKGDAKHEKDTVMTPYDSIKYHKQLLQTSFAAMDPKTGEIKAWVGGINYKWFKYDHVTASRQVGSTFKPLLYTLAVTDAGYTPETYIPGGSLTMSGKTITGGGGTMANCLAFSKNFAAWYIMHIVGTSRTVEFAKSCGITAKIPMVPSIALGSADIPMLQMLHAYTMFPNKGYSTEPVYVTRIEDKNGNLIHEFPVAQSKQVIGEADAFTMVKIMQGVVQIGTAKRLNSYAIPAQKAGKTGTTNGNTDGWYIGYTPDLLAGTWVGCGDPFIPVYQNNVGGGEMGAPKWGIFMSKVYADKKILFNRQKEFDAPAELKNDLIYADANIANLASQGDSLNEDTGNGDGSDFFGDEPVEDIAPVTPDTPKNKKPDDKNNVPKAQMKPADDKKNQPKPKPKNDNDY